MPTDRTPESPVRQNTDNESRSASTRFIAGVLDGYGAPILGALQLSGHDVDAVRQKHDGSLADMAGTLLGSAALYTTAVSALRCIPGIGGAVASVAAGTILGFLQPTEKGFGLETRLANGALGGTLMAGMAYGQSGLSKFAQTTAAARAELSAAAAQRSSWLGLSENPKLSLLAASDRLIPKGEISQAFAGNAALGAAYTQLDTRINRGHWASIADTALGATAFGAFSAAAHGLVRAPAPANARSANPTAFEEAVKVARSLGTPLLKQGLKLEHPDEISQFVQRYSRLDRNAPALIQEAVEAGNVRKGTEHAWTNAVRSQTAHRASLTGAAPGADILQAQKERMNLDFGVRSRLPARSEERLIAELGQAAEADYAQRNVRLAANHNPDVDVIRGGLKQIASVVERQHLVSYIFDKYPSAAASMLRREVDRQFGSRASGSRFAWEEAIAFVERSRTSGIKHK